MRDLSKTSNGKKWFALLKESEQERVLAWLDLNNPPDSWTSNGYLAIEWAYLEMPISVLWADYL